MNWDDVRLFLSIAEQGSFRKAATILNVSHSTLSRRIDALEAGLGVKLFSRVNRGLSLTAAGDEMLKTAIPMGEEFDKLQIRINSQDQIPRGKILLTTSDVLFDYFLLEALQEFMTQWPEISIEVDSSIAMLDIGAIEADVAIRITNSPDEQLIGRKLGPYCEAAYASKQYLDAFRKTPGDHCFISPSETFQFQVTLDHPYQAPIKTTFFTPDIRTQMRSARSGFGIACLPCLIGDQEPDLICISNVIEKASIWLLAHKDSRRNKRMSIFREFITDHFNTHQDLLTGNRAAK